MHSIVLRSNDPGFPAKYQEPPTYAQDTCTVTDVCFGPKGCIKVDYHGDWDTRKVDQM